MNFCEEDASGEVRGDLGLRQIGDIVIVVARVGMVRCLEASSKQVNQSRLVLALPPAGEQGTLVQFLTCRVLRVGDRSIQLGGVATFQILFVFQGCELKARTSQLGFPLHKASTSLT